MADMNYPRTVEDLVHSKWFPKLRTLVSNFRLNEPIDDTLGDIIYEMINKNYLSRWEPSCGSYSNWIYTFASNICKKKYNKSNTRGGKALENASSIQPSADSDEDIPLGVFFEDKLNVEDEDSSNLDFNLLCEEISNILQMYPAHSTNQFKGVLYKRDMHTVFNLLRQQYQPKEIAEMFGTSVEFIYTLIRRMRPIIIRVL